jgi:hypothetical protein
MRTFAAAIAVLLGIGFLVINAPGYLSYSEQPRKSDAIILFLGNEYKDRRAEAVRLIRDGYADYLLIPAYGKLVKAADVERSSRNGVPFRPSHYPGVYEDTHIEVLEAKKLMDRNGLKSAIFVSSPYHMRRIRLIANRVFTDGGYRTTFVPTRFEKPTNALWFLNGSAIRKVAGEYGKIAWFFLYRWVR